MYLQVFVTEWMKCSTLFTRHYVHNAYIYRDDTLYYPDQLSG